MADEDRDKTPNTAAPDDAALFGRIVDILEEAWSHVARTVNSAMVVAYWLIGREIVEEEQKGRKRADYGKAVIEDLSRRLTGRYGKGYSTVSLWNMRKFYQTYIGRAASILSPSGREFRRQEILSPVGRELGKSENPHAPGGEYTPKQQLTGELKRLIDPDVVPVSERFEFRWLEKGDFKRNSFAKNAVFPTWDAQKEATGSLVYALKVQTVAKLRGMKGIFNCLEQPLYVTKKWNLCVEFGERLVAF